MAEEAIFSFILESLQDLVIHETQFLLGVEDQVQKLEQQLNHMRWFLRDTSANQERVLEWVIQVRNLAYEAEYLIESYAIKVASPRQGGIRGTIKRISGCFNECYHRHNIGSDIETLMSKISDHTKSMNEYGITQIMGNTDDGASVRSQLRRTHSMFDDKDEMFVGSDHSINMLVEKVVSDKYRSITLYGMGGLGKTTLARKLYYHQVVMKHFDGFAWVSISQQWRTDDILQRILIKLMPQKRDDIQKWREEELVRELSKYLLTTKCLVVLDDIWTVDAWHSIESAIPIKEKGSKILLTTRSSGVGTLVDAYGYKHEPQFLTTDDSWKLLCNKALKGQDSEETMKMEKVGKEIIAQCDGLPLAVVAIGGILASKHGYNEWEKVRDNMKSYLLKERNGEKNVETILALSYYYLPFHLKPCFLYLSKYAEDAKIKAETIYQQWMGEGMISSKDRMGNNETIMDVAEHYLNELAERCMVFVQKEEVFPYRRFRSCRLHDLMRDLCISKAKEEKFLHSIDYGNRHDVDEGRGASSICRLSISFLKGDDGKRFVPPTKDVRRSIRSFTLEFQDHQKENALKLDLSEFFMLRVLSLDGVGTNEGSQGVYDKKFDPLSIGKLVHLRYLMLRYNRFPVMSSSISNLKLLQTLDLRHCDKLMWISDVWNLPRLNHLYLPYTIQLGDPAKKLEIDGMPQLEILEGFNNTTCNVKHLSTLKNLGKLEARVKDKLEDLEEVINQVRKLTDLRVLELAMEIRDLTSEKAEAIMKDILFYSNLVTLEIKGKLSKFTEYDTGLCQNLRTLRLYNCKIKEDPVRTLERLPNLRKLTLEYESYVGKEMSCHASGFPQLRELWLGGQYLEKWEIEDGAMPNLIKLTIGRCYQLSMIPAGLRSNTLLKELNIYIRYMPEEFKKRIRVNEEGEEGPDFHKLRHVQTIRIID